MDTNNIKIKLGEEKAFLVSGLNDIAKQDENGKWVPVPLVIDERESDENDLADKDEDFEERASLVETFSKRLSNIDQALSNIENGSYGVCVSCGGKIEEDRLEANLSALTCKSCMNK